MFPYGNMILNVCRVLQLEKLLSICTLQSNSSYIFEDCNLKKLFGNFNLVLDLGQICAKKSSEVLAIFVQVGSVPKLEHTHDLENYRRIFL